MKEVKQLVRDPVALALTFVFPILLIAIFISISQAFNAPAYDVRITIADLDDSAVSQIIVDKLSATRFVRLSQLATSSEQAVQLVESGAVGGALIIPKGFGYLVTSTGSAFLVVITDNSKLTTSQIIQIAINRGTQGLLDELSGKGLVASVNVDIINRPISGRRPSGHMILPGMLGLIVILGSFDDIVNAITRERERGTFARLALAPINTLAIYLGKMSATVILTAVRTTLMLLIFLSMGVPVRGDPLLVYATTTLLGIFTLSVGLVLSARIKSSVTLTILEIAMTFPLWSLSGAGQSVQLLASGGRSIATSLPWTYANQALRHVIYLGLGLDAIAYDWAILGAGSILMLGLATVLFKRGL